MADTIRISRIPNKLVFNVMQVAEVYQVKMVKMQQTPKKKASTASQVQAQAPSGPQRPQRPSDRPNVQRPDASSVEQPKPRKTEGLGEGDCILISALGNTQQCTREFLVNNFLTLSGKKLKPISMRYDTTYTIMRAVKTECLAARVPKGGKVKFLDASGEEIKPGTILVMSVAKVNPDWENEQYLDMTGAGKVNERLFKKVYCITKLSQLLTEKLGIAAAESGRKVAEQNKLAAENARKAEMARQKAEYEKRKAAEEARRKATGGVQTISKGGNAVTEDTYTITVVLTNSHGNTVGYRLYSNKMGKPVDLTVVETAALCNKGVVENAKFVPKNTETGRDAYIAGVGISLKDLPTMIKVV